MKILYFVIPILFIFTSCTDQSQVFILPNEAVSLITGDSSKTWKLAKRMNNGNRMNMGDCFLSYRQSYYVDMTVKDNNSDNTNCGESLKATWEIIRDEKGHSFIKLKSPQIPQLMNIEEDYKQFKVLLLSQNEMQLAYYHKQFSDKTTTIVDYLVPEDVEVPGRDFHW